jgi:hypothetical protein
MRQPPIIVQDAVGHALQLRVDLASGRGGLNT